MTLEVVTQGSGKVRSDTEHSIEYCHFHICKNYPIKLGNEKKKKIFGTGWKIIILRAKEVQPQISGIFTREGITDSDLFWKLDTNNRTYT